MTLTPTPLPFSRFISSILMSNQLSNLELPEWADLRLPAKEAWQSTEHDLQKHLVKRFKLLSGQWRELQLIHAIPNGGGRSKAEAGRLKAEGVKSGVSDLFLPVARGRYHGLYIELKKAGGTPTSDQKWWAIRMHEEGYRCVICNDPETVMSVITAYLSKKRFTGISS